MWQTAINYIQVEEAKRGIKVGNIIRVIRRIVGGGEVL